MDIELLWDGYASLFHFNDAVRRGGDTKITPSPRTKSISIVLFDVYNHYHHVLLGIEVLRKK